MQFTNILCLASAVLGGFHAGQTLETNSKYEIHGSTDKAGSLVITLFSQSAGWFAFGIGSEMVDAAITVAWLNSSGGYVISDRRATAQKLPAVTAKQSTILSSTLAMQKPAWATKAVTFVLPGTTVTKSQQYIYAYGNKQVALPDRFDSAFSQHDDFDQPGAIDFSA